MVQEAAKTGKLRKQTNAAANGIRDRGRVISLRRDSVVGRLHVGIDFI